MEIEIISNENVIPSSPTPIHLQNYKLSMLDQLVPPMLVPIVMYFPNYTNPNPQLSISHTTELLKTLVISDFDSILIGNDGLSIDCNDEGVPFSVAKINGHNLSDLLINPDPQLSHKLAPCEIGIDIELGPGVNLAMMRINHFDCGGIAIGAVFWHKVADAAAIGTFLNSWAATARGSKELSSVSPNYIAQSLFPQKEELRNQPVSLNSLLKKGKSVMRRYVFDELSISKLKAKAGVVLEVEVVSALIWKCFMAASLENNVVSSLLTHAVNLRRRAEPRFTSDCFGNFPGLAAASSTNGNDKEFGELVKEMRDAISKIDGEFVDRLMGDDGVMGHYENLGRIWSVIPEGADYLSISSWCGFGLYDVDVGWGKPIWLSRCDAGGDSESRFLNMVWLNDTKSGGGVEAWVTLDEKYMEIFDDIDELQSLVSKDHSPLESYLEPMIKCNVITILE